MGLDGLPDRSQTRLEQSEQQQQQQQWQRRKQQQQQQQPLGPGLIMPQQHALSPTIFTSSSSSSSSSSQPQLAKQQEGGSSSKDRPAPEPPAASGAPPRDTAGSSSSSSSSGSEQQQQQQPVSSAGAAEGDVDVDAVVDKLLDKTWQELKRDLKKEMSPEQAAIIDSWNVSDIQTDKVFRDIAEQQLGPILQMMGISDDPYAFFLDMFKLALGLQLGSAALVFYGSELGLGLDAGDAFRAVGGLALGYFLRLGIKIETLAWPLYNAFVQLLIREDAVYEYPAASPEERQDTLNKLGLAIASAFFVPKLLFGWQNDDCWQIVVPMVGGLFLFDMCYIVALLIKLWGHEDRQE
ncbi:hypothetical protein OEZ85_009746 [Tetradesmus obliquus]|uniref:Uncharacterized protein n=1 Tax=Tetradesmus obliquus TaxID=3088 RepID=A0ABY8U9Y0_TETOB|nr:hypothetical protein OEZ85_009746 [Tetradesmus obliquus]